MVADVTKLIDAARKGHVEEVASSQPPPPPPRRCLRRLRSRPRSWVPLTAARGLTAQDVLAVGDGANDLGMLQLAGTGVALHAKPIVQEQVSVRINYGDLTALLYLQGYSSSQFVTP